MSDEEVRSAEVSREEIERARVLLNELDREIPRWATAPDREYEPNSTEFGAWRQRGRALIRRVYGVEGPPGQ